MKELIVLTGANGFLGTQIAQRLIKNYDHKIVVLVRGRSNEDAVNRLCRAWWEFPDLLTEIDKRIQVLRGDITQNQLGLEKEDYNSLSESITHIIHTAADWSLKSSLEELEKINVLGTKNVLKLAKYAHKDHKLKRFSHISTAYVAGGKRGTVSEDSLSSEQGFLSDYEKTKFESEVEVKKSELDFSIFRPSMIIGDSSTGYVKTFNTVYVPLRLYLSGKLKLLPVLPSMKINMVPVDYVADSVLNLTFHERAKNKTFHLTAPQDSLPTVKELIRFVKKWGKHNLNLTLNDPVYMPLGASKIQKIASKGNLFGNPKLLQTMKTLSPYFNENREYQRNNTRELLGSYDYDWKEFLPKILQFAVYHGFLHRSDRTVHEQALFRLKKSNRPVNYHDIVNNHIKSSSSIDIYESIISATKSLQEMGISKGDRVAMVGFNSTRYLILDIAIGLAGAVSVPLYYTSHLDEIKEIIADSGAKILFAGTPQILNDLKERDIKIPVVSFYQGKLDECEFLSWKKFLETGENKDEIEYVPLNFDDSATIRYTSGTTGKPKGVVFNHGHIRWMAEFIASMPPWKDRTSEVFYLSFLPMNHVVEGIMGTYSPYYAPASLNIYFLENFHDLDKALPMVRPKIFFSVPRFYEKVWCKVLESRIGRIYINSSGILKKFLGKLIKRQILKKTGLDRCAQLIVGSAPISDDLIRYYHDLGIEVHNAYGLTEAPLVTINRIGRNRIGTVGEPLPETEINIDVDGEILVKGPQITSGYFKKDSSILFKDGWLHTGDYGNMTPEGSLIITGRKKEFIVNSYGKTISPLKIEGLLKNIPGIGEAMVIGDGKPYCSAFLWSEDVPLNFAKIDERIGQINIRLSRPEEIKGWVVLDNDLSIGVDLTANLKLKRTAILKRYGDVVNFIYGNGSRPPKVLYHGHLEVQS